MPVEEPTGYDLWSEVGPKVQWPQTNEDQMADLGRTWNDAGAGFMYAGAPVNDENGLGAAWQDDAGRKYATTLTSLHGQAGGAGAEMKRLGGLATAFGEDVRYTKDSIVNMIAQNDRVYQSMSNFFGWPDSAARSAFADKVSNAINQFIDQMANRIAGRGKGGENGARPQLGTDPNTPPGAPGTIGQCTVDNPTGAPQPPARPPGVPEDWTSHPADNGKGTVWQKPGPHKHPDSDSMRVADPTTQYPNGYVRFYNSEGQPIGLNGKPNVSKADSHIPRAADGSYELPQGW